MNGGLFKSASRFALVAAAGILAGGVAAQAADLGGNCCADLEERVAELEATAARKGNRKVSLTVSGQVNKAILWHDDNTPHTVTAAGAATNGSTTGGGYRPGRLTVRDNDASMSRFRFNGSAKINSDLSAGYQLEIGVIEDNGVNTQGANSLNFGNLLIRENNVYFDSKTYGRVTLGQKGQATDGLFEITLANTMNTGGSLDEEGTGILSTKLSGAFAHGIDGSRRQGVVYQTPTIAGFIMSASWNSGTQTDTSNLAAIPHPTPVSPTDSVDQWDVALRYAGEFSGFRLAAGIGFRHTDGLLATSDTDIILGSGSIMHTATGLFVSGGAGSIEGKTAVAGAGDRSNWWVEAGIEQNWFGIGKTTLYGQYSVADRSAANLAASALNFEGDMYRIGVVQAVDAAAADFYLNWGQFNQDAKGAVASDSANVVVGGMRIKF